MVAVVLAGVAGYRVIEGWPAFDALYMTVITLGSVGYSETHPLSHGGRLFTIFLILGGIGVLTYAVSTFTAFLVEGELQEALRRRRMQKKIEALSNHFIICGGGSTGRSVMDELGKTGRAFVVIDQDAARAERFVEEGHLVLVGDADEDAILTSAGVGRARGLAACLPEDKDNLYVVITARGMNPKLRIISKAVEKGVAEKFHRSGADAVVSPQFIGGLRIASELVRPAVVSFLDTMLRDPDGSHRIEEVTVGPDAGGKTLAEMNLNKEFDLTVLAVRLSGTEDFRYNPKPETSLAGSDVLVVLGPASEAHRLQRALN